MKTIHQLLRQPGKTIAGCVMIALAVAALILSLGQNIAADRAQQRIEGTLRTVALLTDAFQIEIETVELPGETHTDRFGNVVELPGRTVEYERRNPLMPEAVSRWVEQLPRQYPDLVEQIADHGFLSAWIPELYPDLYTSGAPAEQVYFVNGNLVIDRFNQREPIPFGTPYDAAMLEITLTDIGEAQILKTPEGEVSSISLVLEGTIQQVIALQEGYPDNIGYRIHLNLTLPDEQTLQNLDLEQGGRYLVYGTGYYDLDRMLRHQIVEDYSQRLNVTIELDAFDPENLRLYDQTILDKYESYGQSRYSVGYYVHNGDLISLDNVEYEMFRKIYLELDWVENHNADPQRYAVPNLVRLDGSAEAFLASEAGTLWRETLEYLEINSQCFPVLAVGEVENVGEFARGNARIVSGRSFTPEESARGDRLCVISEQVAAAAGLSVGDTITLRYYGADPENPYQYFVDEGRGVTNPSAYRFGKTTPFAGEGMAYTIVGLYRYAGAWAAVEDNLYAITPNTVFVPSASVSWEMSRSDQGVFRTVVLRNNALRDFIVMAEEAGYGELFVYYDQGYNTVSESIEEYRVVAGRAMLVGIIIYGIILLLYLILFPATLERDLILMDSLGANRCERVLHAAMNSFGMLFTGTVLGCCAGAALWNQVADALARSAEVSLELDLGLWGFAQIALGQLAFAMGLLLILAYWMTRPRTLAGRK